MKLFTAFLILMVLTGAALAQSTGNQNVSSDSVAGQNSRIYGTVTDGTGAVVPAVEITAIGSGGEMYRTTSNSEGRFDLNVPVGNYRVEFSAHGFNRLQWTNITFPTTEQKPITAVLETDPTIISRHDLFCFANLKPIPVEALSVSTDITLPLPGTKNRKAASLYKLSGRIIDPAGAAISDVKILAISKIGGYSETITNEKGDYDLLLSTGEYSLKIEGVPGFRKTFVHGLQIKDRPLTLDIALDVDLESPTSIYTELTCDSNGMCKLVSRKGDGSTEPKLVIVNPR
jgi:hypothetical protein